MGGREKMTCGQARPLVQHVPLFCAACSAASGYPLAASQRASVHTPPGGG